MKNRPLVITVVLIMSCMVASNRQVLYASPAKPNILFILTDDLGYGDLGVLYQNDRTQNRLYTPHLDRMATEGMILNRHYCPAPVCAPSRGSLLSGLHQGHANVRNNQFDKALADNHTLGTTLQAAGYYTMAIGKWGLQGSGNSAATWPAYPTKRGFDDYYGYVRHTDGHQHYPANNWPMGNSTAHRNPKELWDNELEVSAHLDKCYTTDLFTARAKQTIIDHTANNPHTPFFIYLAYDTPHAALQLPTMAFPEGKGLDGGLRWIGQSGQMINTAGGKVDSYYDPLYLDYNLSDAHRRYATSVTRIDHCIGDLLQTLRDLKIEENTLVVFSNDNGPLDVSYIANQTYNPQSFQSYGPFEGIKRDTYEGGIRMPTLVWGPNQVIAEQISEHPSQFHDWMATFCDFAGIVPPAATDGVSLRPTLTQSGLQKNGIVYVEYDNGGKLPTYPDFKNHAGTTRNEPQVIYLDGYKGIRNNTTSHSVDFKIYDTSTDLKEAHNLADTNTYFQQLGQRMKDRVLQIRMPDNSAPRAYDNVAVPPLAGTSKQQGITVSTYEGHWPWVPEFQILTPISIETTARIDLNLLSRETDAGLLFTGYLKVPTTGHWTFYAQADEGIVLRIHDKLVMNADFKYDGSEIQQVVKLEAGLHPLRLYYRTAEKTPELKLQWSGPRSHKSPIPISQLYVDAPNTKIMSHH